MARDDFISASGIALVAGSGVLCNPMGVGSGIATVAASGTFHFDTPEERAFKKNPEAVEDGGVFYRNKEYKKHEDFPTDDFDWDDNFRRAHKL